jgi:hypothetical protein
MHKYIYIFLGVLSNERSSYYHSNGHICNFLWPLAGTVSAYTSSDHCKAMDWLFCIFGIFASHTVLMVPWLAICAMLW